MLRQLKSVALVAATLGLVASASADMNFESSGAMKWRGEEFSDTLGTAANGANSRSTDYMSMAINWDLKFMPDPKVMVFFQPKYVRKFGDDSFGSNQITAGTTTSGGTVDTGLDVHQGYLTYMHDDRMSFSMGRYEMNYGDAYVIGNVGWSMVGRAFDGLKMNYKWSKGWMDVFFNKISERDNTGNSANTADDNDFYGLYHSMAIGDIFSAFDLYYLVSSTRATQTQPAPSFLLNTMGVRLKGAKGMVDYKAEYVTQSGGATNSSNVKTDVKDATSMDVEVGATINQNWRIGAEMSTAGKDYNQLYPTGHKWLGFADLLSRRNINDTVVHVSGKFMEHMTLGADYHMFTRNETALNTAAGAYGNTGNAVYNFAGAAYGTGAVASGDDVGTEMDLVLTCNKLKALAWQLGYSQFSAGKYMKDELLTTNGTAVVADSIQFVYLQATAKF